MIDIQPVEAEGVFWVRLSMDGGELKRHGPFSADEAEAMAARFAATCRALFPGEVRIHPEVTVPATTARRQRA
jgi:hypothetical protein